MTNNQRDVYLLLLQAGREAEAIAYRDRVEAETCRANELTEYSDKHGRKIRAGMMIRIGDDEPEEVLVTAGDDLGVNASNKEYLKHHPDAVQEVYLLSNFDKRDIEIVGGWAEDLEKEG
jgi:hypothetical protein